MNPVYRVSQLQLHFPLIISEWNSSVKEKWNSKSIYVVGKATAALGELLSLMKPLFSLLKKKQPFVMSILIVAECGGHLVLTEVCEVLLPPSVI